MIIMRITFPTYMLHVGLNTSAIIHTLDTKISREVAMPRGIHIQLYIIFFW